MRRILHRSILVCILTGMLVFTGVFPALAEKTPEQKLSETDDAIERLEEKSKEAKEKLEAEKR